MQKQEPISNQTQIFRHDARGCFVEAKCDRFHLDRVHLQFVAYDKNRPQGQRYTNNVNIYIPIPEFLVLYQEAASGVLHGRMQQYMWPILTMRSTKNRLHLASHWHRNSGRQ